MNPNIAENQAYCTRCGSDFDFDLDQEGEATAQGAYCGSCHGVWEKVGAPTESLA